ncbi:MAG: transglutaminase-like domain-containing protein [Candidatus Micrarchaeia archaeon]
MFKRPLLFLLLFAALASCLAANEAGSSKLAARIEWTVNSPSDSGSQFLESYAFPSTPFQTVSYYSDEPYVESVDDYGNARVRFSWNAFKGEKTTSLLASASVDYSRGFEPVEGDTTVYVEASRRVILDSQVKALAGSVAGGARSRFEELVLLTDWVHGHVEYDLEFFGSREPDSNEVLSERKGSCTEESHVLLAFLRSRGIPARFVAGFVYSGEAWGPHAWVEASINGEWVPADPVFNEVGLLDASHVKFCHAPDHSFVFEEMTQGIGLSRSLSVTVSETSGYPNTFAFESFEAPESVSGASALFTVEARLVSLVEREQAVALALSVPQEPGFVVAVAGGNAERLVYLPPFSEVRSEWTLVLPGELSASTAYNFSVLARARGTEREAFIQAFAGESQLFERVAIEGLTARLEGKAVSITVELVNQGNADVFVRANCTLAGESRLESTTVKVGGKRLVQFLFPEPEGGANGSLTVETTGSTLTQPFSLSFEEAVAPASEDNALLFGVAALLVVVSAGWLLSRR